MANRPTVTDLISLQGLQVAASGASRPWLTECISAALDQVENRVNLPITYVDTQHNATPGADDGYPQRVRQAVLLQASRYVQRKDSPSGVVGWGEYGAVRMLAMDSDVEQLIAQFLKLDGFA